MHRQHHDVDDGGEQGADAQRLVEPGQRLGLDQSSQQPGAHQQPPDGGGGEEGEGGDAGAPDHDPLHAHAATSMPLVAKTEPSCQITSADRIQG